MSSQNPTKRRGPGSRDTRARILDAAAEEVAASGRLSVKAVAARVGLSRQAVHYHVGGRRSLQEALEARGLAFPTGSERDTRERLLEAAVRVLSRPAADTSLEAIALEAGLTKGAVYHHFPDRRSLLRAVAQRITPIEELAAVVRATADASDGEALAALLEAYRAAMIDRSFLIRRLVAAGSRDPDLVEVISEELLARGAPILLTWWADRVARGTLRPVPPPLVFQALFGAAWAEIILGPTILTRIREMAGMDPNEVTAAYVDMLLEGIATKPAQV